MQRLLGNGSTTVPSEFSELPKSDRTDNTPLLPQSLGVEEKSCRRRRQQVLNVSPMSLSLRRAQLSPPVCPHDSARSYASLLVHQ